MSADVRALLDARGFAWRLHLLLGSVAQQIIDNAQGAALVVRAPAAPEEKVAC
jgi:nucleotide-binding universal stress UspA family protein